MSTPIRTEITLAEMEAIEEALVLMVEGSDNEVWRDLRAKDALKKVEEFNRAHAGYRNMGLHSVRLLSLEDSNTLGTFVADLTGVTL